MKSVLFLVFSAFSAYVSNATPIAPKPEGLTYVPHQSSSAVHQVNLDKRNMLLAAATGVVSVATSIGGFIVGKKSNDRREKIDIEKAERDEEIRRDLEKTRKSVEKQQKQLESEQQRIKERQEKLEQDQKKMNDKQNELDATGADDRPTTTRSGKFGRKPEVIEQKDDDQKFPSDDYSAMSSRSNRIRNVHSGQYRSRVQSDMDM